VQIIAQNSAGLIVTSGGGGGGTPSENADAVWDELMSGHTLAGSFGVRFKKLLTLAKFLGLKDS